MFRYRRAKRCLVQNVSWFAGQHNFNTQRPGLGFSSSPLICGEATAATAAASSAEITKQEDVGCTILSTPSCPFWHRGSDSSPFLHTLLSDFCGLILECLTHLGHNDSLCRYSQQWTSNITRWRTVWCPGVPGLVRQELETAWPISEPTYTSRNCNNSQHCASCSHIGRLGGSSLFISALFKNHCRELLPWFLALGRGECVFTSLEAFPPLVIVKLGTT